MSTILQAQGFALADSSRAHSMRRIGVARQASGDCVARRDAHLSRLENAVKPG